MRSNRARCPDDINNSPEGRAKYEKGKNMDAEKYLTTNEKRICEQMRLTAEEYLTAKREAREREEAEEIAAVLKAKAKKNGEEL